MICSMRLSGSLKYGLGHKNPRARQCRNMSFGKFKLVVAVSKTSEGSGSPSGMGRDEAKAVTIKWRLSRSKPLTISFLHLSY